MGFETSVKLAILEYLRNSAPLHGSKGAHLLRPYVCVVCGVYDVRVCVLGRKT